MRITHIIEPQYPLGDHNLTVRTISRELITTQLIVIVSYT